MSKATRKARKHNPPFDDYFIELDHKRVRVRLFDGTTLVGKLHAKAKYNVKLEGEGGKYIYINKAYIVMIEPLE